ncbi:PQQ-dependent sugar dehydrogenase [Litchfieldia alkalitelluris]|uniref:PQQ-dependent sugar dehydrogenase n=1 Tax=Litchfieldia alkalitelluris TaxID=304268 RepID=UPI001F1E224A|nr:PQQ-dependent sugar dehydrogenase [Litchfieldia alkalitelluris]
MLSLRIILALIFVLFISGCSFEDEPTNEDEVNEAFARQAEIVTAELDIPWNITKQGDSFYLSQRAGKIIKVNEADGSKEIQNVEVTKQILHESEGGFLGFILAPDFESSGEAYGYHTYEANGQVYNRIILLKFTQNSWQEQEVILEGIPGGRIHNGGRIKIGIDGKLYATTGDAGNPEYAQNLDNLAGKILRMELDGSVPEDNPYPDSYIYSYGHRNPQGLAWDHDGKLYSSEHGQSAHDEINLIEPGKNYGWPLIEGEEQGAEMISPLYQTGTDTWAPSGIAIQDRKMFVATLRGESIRVVNLDTMKVDLAFENLGRLRDVFIENDTLYTITNNRDGRGTPREGDDKLFKLSLK